MTIPAPRSTFRLTKVAQGSATYPADHRGPTKRCSNGVYELQAGFPGHWCMVRSTRKYPTTDSGAFTDPNVPRKRHGPSEKSPNFLARAQRRRAGSARSTRDIGGSIGGSQWSPTSAAGNCSERLLLRSGSRHAPRQFHQKNCLT